MLKQFLDIPTHTQFHKVWALTDNVALYKNDQSKPLLKYIPVYFFMNGKDISGMRYYPSPVNFAPVATIYPKDKVDVTYKNWRTIVASN